MHPTLKTAYITHQDFLKHEMFAGHPEAPERLLAIQEQLQVKQLWDFLNHFEAPSIEQQTLLYAHSQQHIDYIFQHAPQTGQPRFHVDPDTFMNEHSLLAALKAAGAGTLAVDLVMKKQINNAFCAVRPPGHHAEKNKAMGFCFFNNIAVAASYTLEKYKLERVAILDFDVHHGNGTEDIFENDLRVMVCSSYEHPLFPYSGRPTIPGHLINSPLKPDSTGEDFRKIIHEQWLPELETFKPQFIFISAGFDAHWEDDISTLKFSDSDYAWITQKITEIAANHAENRVISMLEGGYSLKALGRSVEQHIRVLMGLD